MTRMQQSGSTPYDQMGGAVFFETLVRHFYAGVASDPVLRAMYPAGDLAEAERHLRMFLEQYWGGPTVYSDERGHPRLRMRHAPFVVDDDARDRWLAHMRAALELTKTEVGLDPALEAELWRYLVGAAIAMVNTSSGDTRPGLTVQEGPA
jgi:hemoglobin